MEGITHLDSPELRSALEKYSPFLREVRKRVFITLIIFGVSAAIGFVYFERIVRLLIKILGLEGINVVFTSPFQYISLSISAGIATGIVFSLPLLIGQIMLFLRPALKKKEYRMILRFLPLSIVLFLTGFSFGALIMKWQIQIFLTKSIELGIGNILDITSLLTTVLLVSIFMGISFQFPVILTLLMRIGAVNRQQITKQRKWVWLGSFIFAILLPADSIIIDVILSLPLIALFELTMVLARRSKAAV